MLGGRSTERAGAFLLGALTLAGCLLTTTLDGLSGGSSGTTPDGTTPDGATPDGATPDGGSLGDAGPFCESKPSTLLLCADFDDGKFPAPFAADSRGTGAVVAATGDVRSPPFAALFTAPAAAKQTVGATLLRTLPSGAKSIVVELDIHLEEVGAGADYDLLTISAGSPEIGVQINEDATLSWDEDFSQPNDAGMGGVEVALGRSLPSGWTHVKWSLDVNGAIAMAELFIDGTSAGRRAFSSDVLSGAAPTLEIGDSSQGALTKEWRLRIDNITVDFR